MASAPPPEPKRCKDGGAGAGSSSSNNTRGEDVGGLLLTEEELSQVALQLCGPRLEAPPGLDELRARLAEPLPAALPVSHADLADAASALEVGGYSYQRTLEFLRADTRHVTARQFPSLGYVVADRSELVRGRHPAKKMIHGFLGPLLQDTLLTFAQWLDVEWARHLKPTRNSAQLDCPDWQLFGKRFMVFRGVEVRDDLPLDQARVGLLSTLEAGNPVLGGGAPYVLAYACAGVELQLFAIHRVVRDDGTAAPRAALFPLGDELLLSRAADRFKLVRYVAKLVRVIQAIET